jgi:hypothetical protein
MNLFIESIEGGTYLAAYEQGNQRDYLRDRNSKTLTFHCISEIKNHLAGQEFERVTLRQSTPYDEMCGQSMGGESLELEIEW